MMNAESYQYADLDKHEDLLQDLRSLESRMKQELGHDIALIAYTQKHDGQDK